MDNRINFHFNIEGYPRDQGVHYTITTKSESFYYMGNMLVRIYNSNSHDNPYSTMRIHKVGKMVAHVMYTDYSYDYVSAREIDQPIASKHIIKLMRPSEHVWFYIVHRQSRGTGHHNVLRTGKGTHTLNRWNKCFKRFFRKFGWH